MPLHFHEEREDGWLAAVMVCGLNIWKCHASFSFFFVLLDLTIKLWDFHQESLIDASYSFIGHTVSLIERIEKPKH